MRLSTVFELLLIFLLIAFAAYGRVIDETGNSLHRLSRDSKQTNFDISILSLKQATENVNKYCTCLNNICNCCRNFHIPIVRLQGPGCASLQYLREDNLALQLSFGDNILTSTVISGKKPRAICVPMPGGLSKFCGRIYSISREPDNHFKACLGLELESSTELEASLRVSCFRFGPDGLQLRPAEPLPIIEAAKPADNDDDDDDFDIFGLDDDTEDSDEDGPTRGTENNVPVNPSNENDDEDEEEDDEDILGFGALIDLITGDDDSVKRKPTTATPISFTIPSINKSTSIPSATQPPKPVKDKPLVVTKKPEELPQSSTIGSALEIAPSPTKPSSIMKDEETTSSEIKSTLPPAEESPSEEIIEDSTVSVLVGQATDEEKNTQPTESEITDDPTTVPELTTNSVIKPANIKKIVGIKTVKKPSIASTNLNTIPSDSKKPSVKPTTSGKPDPIANIDEDDDENEEDYALTSDEDEDADIDASVEAEGENEYEDDDDDDEDESEEEEDAVLTALVSDDDKEQTKDVKVQDNETSKPEEDDADYGMGLAELLARKRRMRSGRQSKVMRL